MIKRSSSGAGLRGTSADRMAKSAGRFREPSADRLPARNSSAECTQEKHTSASAGLRGEDPEKKAAAELRAISPHTRARITESIPKEQWMAMSMVERLGIVKRELEKQRFSAYGADVHQAEKKSERVVSADPEARCLPRRKTKDELLDNPQTSNPGRPTQPKTPSRNLEDVSSRSKAEASSSSHMASAAPPCIPNGNVDGLTASRGSRGKNSLQSPEDAPSSSKVEASSREIGPVSSPHMASAAPPCIPNENAASLAASSGSRGRNSLQRPGDAPSSSKAEASSCEIGPASSPHMASAASRCIPNGNADGPTAIRGSRGGNSLQRAEVLGQGSNAFTCDSVGDVSNANLDYTDANQMPESLRRRLDQRATNLRTSQDERRQSSCDKATYQHAMSASTRGEGTTPQSRRPVSQPSSSASPDGQCPNDHGTLPPIRPSSLGSPPPPSPPKNSSLEKFPSLDGGDSPNAMRRCRSLPQSGPAQNSEKLVLPAPKERTRRHSFAAKSVCDDDGEKQERQMFDKNELRANNKDLFMAAVEQKRKEIQANVTTRATELGAGTSATVRVYVRKRPIFAKEEDEKRDYDILTVIPGAPFPKQATLHSCMFQADLKTPFINHHTFNFDCVFDDHVENKEVYVQAARPIVLHACRGGMGTMFMFGQTGSGKTHTMTAIEDLAAQEIFSSAQSPGPCVSVHFIELRGNRVFDLLTPKEDMVANRALTELKLRDHQTGSYVADGATVCEPVAAKELCDIIHMAHSRRATSSTDANDVSSRSHAVCILRMLQSEGQLLLVDCAGTERRKDSMYHTKERQMESNEINASLYALKECIRHLITKHHVPTQVFRSSSLTKVLMEAFSQGTESQLAVICTASPCASDTEHTLSTLRTGVSLCAHGKENEERQQISVSYDHRKSREHHPKAWTSDRVRSWIMEIAGGKFRTVVDVLPSNFTGQMLVRVTKDRCTQLCGGSQARGHELYELLHEEMRSCRV